MHARHRKNYLAVNLATQLQAAGDLTDSGFADIFATSKDLVLTLDAANTDTALADAREYRIAMGILNEVSRTRTAEFVNHRVDVVRESGLCDQGKDRKQ